MGGALEWGGSGILSRRSLDDDALVENASPSKRIKACSFSDLY